MTARLRRVERLVDLAQGAVDKARSEAVAAARAVTEARDIELAGERAWSDAAQRFGTGVGRASDLDEQAAHLRTLRLRADDAHRRAERAVAEERRCAAVVIKAATEHRKLELLRDRILVAQREEESRLERRTSDELAARSARSRQ